MATFAVLRNKVLRMLDDPDGQDTTDDTLKDSVEAALEAIMPWCPNRQIITLDCTSGSAGNKIFALPTDCYRIEAVYDSEGSPLSPAILSPDRYRGEDMETNDWLEYPTGCISFSKPLEEDVTIYYLANWNKPVTTTTVIPIPDHVIAGVTLYAAAYCLIPPASSAASIRQWGTRTDSGTPEDNPLQTRVEKLLKLFEVEMNRHPSYMRAARV